jgi:hypothetical protein
MSRRLEMTKTKRPSRWKDEYYVKIYDLVKGGHSLKEVSSILGVSHTTVDKWVEKRLPLRKALERARSGRSLKGDKTRHVTGSSKNAETFLEYVYKRLPPELQWIWDEIMQWSEAPNAYKRVKALLQGQGRKTRQHLFFHALVHCNFDPSKACTLICLPKATLELWLKEPDFVRLMDEINWHKKNFFEAALIQLVEQGDTNAILFVNKTINRDRGYIDKTEIRVKGAIEHKHSISIDTLNLPLETRRQVLEAVRERKRLVSEGASNSNAGSSGSQTINGRDVIDVEAKNVKKLGKE